jgi:regulator of protease activity HflC (stomatin/prohibitin superfamily)
MMILKLTSLYNPLNFLYPIIFAILFVVSIIIDKWIKHSEAENGRTEAFFHNSRVFFYLTRLSLLLLTIATVIKLLNFGELQKYLYYALIVVFYYASVLMLISLVVCFIKKELTEKPKIIIPLPFAGKDKNDLSVLSFLENNTGITMRGLWSMKLIKQIVPYTVIAVAALFWLSTGIVQVESYQEATVYRMGVLREETLKPGLHLVLPAPFDKVEYYDTQKVNKVSIGYVAKEDTDNLWTGTHGSSEHKLLLGGGNELVSINLKIEYKISDLRAYVTKSATPASVLEAHAYDLITQRVIVTDLESLLAVDRGAFTSNFKKDLEEGLSDHDIGIEIVSVVMESIHPPLEIASIYQGVIGAEIQAEEIIRKAENAATVTLTNAQATKESTINKATAENHTKVAGATSSVSEFMASVEANNTNKDSYQYYKYLNALSQAYGKSNLILVGDGVDTSKIYFGNISNGAILGGANGNTQNSTDIESVS